MRRLAIALGMVLGTFVGVRCQRPDPVKEKQELAEARADPDKKPFDEPNMGMTPASEHRGTYPMLKAPEKHATSVGGVDTPKDRLVGPETGAVSGKLEARLKDRVRIRDASGEVVELTVDKETEVIRDRENIAFKALPAGSDVHAAYELEDGKWVATEIEILRSP